MRQRILLCLALFFSCLEIQAAKVGLLVVATGKYIQFVQPLINSARQHFCKDHQVTYFIFTDSPFSSSSDVVVLPHQKKGWPLDTLLRYEAYANAKELLLRQDFLFACDADMLFAGPVGSEILGERVATQHPGFAKGSPFPQPRGSYETNPKSTAYVRDDEGTDYYAGGFWGGSSKAVMHIVETNLQRIAQDRNNGMIAVWHDESYWNRYCLDSPPTVVLSPAYCYPESWNIPYEKKLLALDKNHAEIR